MFFLEYMLSSLLLIPYVRYNESAHLLALSPQSHFKTKRYCHYPLCMIAPLIKMCVLSAPVPIHKMHRPIATCFNYPYSRDMVFGDPSKL